MEWDYRNEGIRFAADTRMLVHDQFGKLIMNGKIHAIYKIIAGYKGSSDSKYKGPNEDMYEARNGLTILRMLGIK